MTAASLLRSAREANLRLDAVSYSALGLDAHGGWRLGGPGGTPFPLFFGFKGSLLK